VDRTFYAGVKIKVIWTNGDVTAYSRVYKWLSGKWVLMNEVAPTVAAYETGLTSGTFAVSHYKNGQETEKVSEN